MGGLGFGLRFIFNLFRGRSSYSAYVKTRSNDYILTRDNRKLLIPSSIDLVSIKIYTKDENQILTKSGIELNLKL